MPTRTSALAGVLLVSLPALLSAASASAQETWQRGSDPRYQQRDDAYRQDPPAADNPAHEPRRCLPRQQARRGLSAAIWRLGAAPQRRLFAAHRQRARGRRLSPAAQRQRCVQPAAASGLRPGPGDLRATLSVAPTRAGLRPAVRFRSAELGIRPALLGAAAAGIRRALHASAAARPTTTRRPTEATVRPPSDRGYGPPPGPRHDDDVADGSYSSREILEAGHGFFGSVSKGLASVVEYAFQKQGRPNGYILGQDAGGAFVAGLRYGEGMLYTKDAGTHRVYWQGPSIG